MAGEELDRLRAAGATLFGATKTTTGDEPLIVDLPLPGTPGSHWVVEALTFMSSLTVRFPAASGNSPLSGLFLCPPNTPAELTSDLSATAVWNPQARAGIMLPLADPFLDTAIPAAGLVAILAMTSQVGFKFSVPINWFLRAIVVAQAGSATPGPGANSFGRLQCMCYQELDKC